MAKSIKESSIDDIAIVRYGGVYFIYINTEFYCSCDSFSEVKEEIENLNVEAV